MFIIRCYRPRHHTILYTFCPSVLLANLVKRSTLSAKKNGESPRANFRLCFNEFPPVMQRVAAVTIVVRHVMMIHRDDRERVTGIMYYDVKIQGVCLVSHGRGSSIGLFYGDCDGEHCMFFVLLAFFLYVFKTNYVREIEKLSFSWA